MQYFINLIFFFLKYKLYLNKYKNGITLQYIDYYKN